MFQILLSAAERENRLRTRLAYFFVKSRHQLCCGKGMGQTSFEKSSPQTMRLKLFQNFLSFHASCIMGRVIPYLKLGIQILPTSPLSLTAWVPNIYI